MTTEDKAKRYDEALERASKLRVQNPFDTVSQMMEHVFPELAESKDERIRKALLSGLKYLETELGWDTVGDVDILDAYAWLKKQETSYTNKDVVEAYTKGLSDAKNEIEKQNEENYQIRKDIATFIFNYRGDIKDRAKWMDYLGIKAYFFEKEYEKPQGKSALDAAKEEKVDNQNCVKSTDKVKPKFHEGDWLQYRNAKPFFVEEITKQGYVNGDSCLPFNWESEIHLWTIKDVNPGDVLVDVYGNIGIYEKCDDYDWTSYCSLGCYGGFQHFKVEHENEKTYPATKEQRELLFTKMEEAGYKWDANKKELKKIEQNHNIHPKFKVGDWVVRGDTIAQILDIQEQYYIGIDINGKDFTSSRFLNDDKIHHWTIQDAKDGDVLVSQYNKPFIYNGNRDYFHIGSYCGISVDDKFKVATEKCNWAENVNIYPSTKEQRELLFTKMKESGYEWDDEEKELKKIDDEPENYKQQVMTEMTNLVKDYIRQKPSWSEEDEKMVKDIQNRWKPSDEQIKAIRLARSFVVDDFSDHPTLSEILMELEEQLQKIKDE